MTSEIFGFDNTTFSVAKQRDTIVVIYVYYNVTCIPSSTGVRMTS